MTPNHVVWIDLASGPPLVDRLAVAHGDPGARVAVLDASTGVGQAHLAERVDLVRFVLPVLFVFEGALVGRAAELALGTDIRIAGRNASLTGPVRNVSRLRTLARSNAELLNAFDAGKPVSAERLHELGLVNAVAPVGEADVEARRLADVVASRGPIATRLAKEAIWRGLPQPLEQALRFETDLTLLLQTTKDRAEGVRAFLEKRQPVFKGE